MMNYLHKSAELSPCGRYRFYLERIWDDSKPKACFIMLNPSTADSAQDDATIRRCVHFADRWGCGSIGVVNLYAYRATDPKDLLAARRSGIDVVGRANDSILVRELAEANLRIAAWGAVGAGQRADQVRRLFGGFPVLALGFTKHGAPRHPLYTPARQPLMDYKISREEFNQ